MSDTSTTSTTATPPGQSPLAPPSYLSTYAHQMEDVQASQQATFDAKEKELAPRYERLEKTLEAGNPAPPKEQKLEAPPNPQDYHKYSQEFLAAAAILGAVAGRFTRAGGTAALNAFSGAIKGWKEGNLQAYEEAMKQWQESTQRTIQNNKIVMDQYKAVLENKKINIDQQMAAIQLIATKYQDKITFDAAAAKNYTMVAQVYEKNQQYTDKMEASAKKIQDAKDRQDEKNHTNAKWLASPEGQAWVAQQPPAEQVKYKGFIEQYGQGTPRSAPAMALRKFIQENPNATAEEVSQFAAHYGAEVKATRDFGSGTQGNAIRSFSVALDHLNVAEQLGQALQTGNSQTLNQVRNIAKQQFGWDGAIDFNFAKKIVGDEITKSILGSGAGTGQDREDIQKAFSAANSPEQLAGVIKTAKRLMAGQLHGLKQQYEQTTGQTNFDTRLSPAARTELENLKPATSGGVPQRPPGVPEGSAYSPSRNMWKDPAGNLFGPDGTPARE